MTRNMMSCCLFSGGSRSQLFGHPRPRKQKEKSGGDKELFCCFNGSSDMT
jgi:hypothetical protein